MVFAQSNGPLVPMTGAIDPIERTYRQLLEQVLGAGEWLSGDHRVHALVAAALLGVSVRTLENWRSSGNGPDFVRLGHGGNKITYRLMDLSEWLQSIHVDGGSRE